MMSDLFERANFFVFVERPHPHAHMHLHRIEIRTLNVLFLSYPLTFSPTLALHDTGGKAVRELVEAYLVILAVGGRKN